MYPSLHPHMHIESEQFKHPGKEYKNSSLGPNYTIQYYIYMQCPVAVKASNNPTIMLYEVLCRCIRPISHYIDLLVIVTLTYWHINMICYKIDTYNNWWETVVDLIHVNYKCIYIVYLIYYFINVSTYLLAYDLLVYIRIIGFCWCRPPWYVIISI